jgi:diguanylate cyclase (GGDEF)-like protein
MARLVLMGDGDDWVEVPLGDERALKIGRAPANDVILEGAKVSRHHCRLEALGDGGHLLVDLGSTNGTYVNGDAIQAMVLDYDDRLLLGRTLVLYLDDVTDPAQVLEQREDVFFPWGPLPIGLAEVEWDGVSTWTSVEGTRVLRRPSSLTLPDAPARPPLSIIDEDQADDSQLHELLRTVVGELVAFCGMERGILSRYDELTGELTPYLGVGVSQDALTDAERLIVRRITTEALASEGLVVRDGLSHDDSFPQGAGLGRPIESAVCLPLNAPRPVGRQGNTRDRRRNRRARWSLGALYADSTLPARPLAESDRIVLEELSGRAAQALKNARLPHAVDRLTRLETREGISKALDEELRWAGEDATPLAVVALDVDGMPEINRAHGKKVAHEVLRRMAQRARRVMRGDDYAGRWEADRCLLILPGDGAVAARTVAARVARSVTERPIGEPRLRVTLSLGAAAYPEHGATAEELVDHAVEALAAAKAEGGGQIVVWSGTEDSREGEGEGEGGEGGG